MAQDHGLQAALDAKLIDYARPAIDRGEAVEFKMPIRNVDRTVGAMLSGDIARKHGSAGLPSNTIRAQFTGSAGEGFGGVLAHRVPLGVESVANDFIGKVLSAGQN